MTAPDQCCTNVRKFLPGRRPHMTAKADVHCDGRNIRFGPRTDACRASSSAAVYEATEHQMLLAALRLPSAQMRLGRSCLLTVNLRLLRGCYRRIGWVKTLVGSFYIILHICYRYSSLSSRAP